MLPNFLCIGAQRAGTTWLYDLLASHPEVYVPARRKEVHFFDWYYNRGLSWYTRFFPSEREANRYWAVGEVTPDYLYDPGCPKRISEILPSVKLIVILRNPVDRAYSHYGLLLRDGEITGSFEELARSDSYVIERGYYSRYLSRYLNHFEREQILVLIFERALRDIENVKQRLSSYLNIQPSLFPSAVGKERINRGYLPRAHRAYTLAKRTATKLREWDMDWAVNLAKRVGMARLFGSRGPLPPISHELRAYLTELYRHDIQKLESLLETSISDW